MKEKDRYFYSNCFIEMVKAKLKNPKVKIMYLPAFLNWDNEKEQYCPVENNDTIEILNEMFGGKIVEIG